MKPPPTEAYEIKTNIEVGRQIFENIPNELRPGWAGLILSRFDPYIKGVPTEVKELFPIIDNEGRWYEAHEQFSKIRVYLLNHKNYQPEYYLHLAELVAKTTYNASYSSAPFDEDSGWYIPSFALKAAEHFNETTLEDELTSTILVFRRNEKLSDSLTAAKEYIAYKRIDDILWNDWDPIGINDIAPRDKYYSYIPDMLQLLKANASVEEVSKRLYQLETINMGVPGDIETCRKVAEKIKAIPIS